ncbi:MAG: hypothetical protein N3B11_07525 [Coriobacteriia bacterium]|nr:hypothetical protein [Coriobacteriia bacterium]
MEGKPAAPRLLRAIIGFYILGVAAGAVALVTNRAATGEQLARVHGVPWLAGAPAILLTLVMGGLTIAGLGSMKPWGYRLTMAYMAYLLVAPPLVVGGSRLSVFANVMWPLFMLGYLYLTRRSFGIGSTEQSASASA